MKIFSIIFNIKQQFTIVFIFSLIVTKIYSKETLDDKIKKICLKAESSVKYYFEEKQELPEKFQNFEFANEFSEDEKKSVINLLLIDEETRNNFMQKKNNEKKYIELIIIVIVVISIIFIFDFEIHFFLRLFFKKDILKPSFTNFYKISPFYWIFYFMLNKQKINILYNEFLNNHTNKRSKYIFLIFVSILILIFVVIFIMIYFVSNEYDNSSQVTINILCTSIKFFNEIQNGKQIKKNGTRLIGFKDINSFLNELMENKNLFKSYFNNYTEAYNEINNSLSEWEIYLTDIQKNLSDKKSSKYFFYNYPSDRDFIKMFCNFSIQNPCKKSLFQTKLIYDYYPYTDNNKKLYEFNNSLYKNTEILLNKFNIFEHSFLDSENPLNFCFENTNLKDGFSKIGTIINIYIQQLLEIDKENFFDKFIYSYLSYIYSFDFILLIFIGLNTLLVLLYVEYYCLKKHLFGRIIISIVFYNIIFMILCMSFFELSILKKINIHFSYIKEISKGIYYILNDEIKNYVNLFNEENNSHFKNISLLIQFKNTQMNNNIINYIMYYINNEKKLKTLLNDKILNININQLKIINNTLNELIDNKNNLTVLNSQINDFSEKILKLLNEGLKHTTYFVDLTSTGFFNSYLEYPLTYLSYANIITRKNTRKEFGYKDISCDETWNISTFDFVQANYKYRSRDFVLCENCINTCSNKKILLNFMEYTMDEIEQRYRFLKNNTYKDIYYELMYYFNATEKLRDKKIFEQLKDLYEMNENLKNIQKNIFNSIEKMEYTAKKIITIYGNIINKYEKEDIFFHYSEFIKDDLYYLIGQIEINFSEKINNEYKKHLKINILCICTCISLIIIYILFAKEIKYYKTDNDELSIGENSNLPQQIIENCVKINQINIEGNKQGYPSLTNVINAYIINSGKNAKINKNFNLSNKIIIGNDINKNKNSIEKINKQNALNTGKILINSKLKKNELSLAGRKNDESKYGLAKDLTENEKENIFGNINKDNHIEITKIKKLEI